MKLKTIDRVLFWILMLIIVGACVIVFCFTWNLIPATPFLAYLNDIYSPDSGFLLGKLLTTAAVLLVLFACIRVLFIRDRRGEELHSPAAEESNGVLIRSGESGSAFITKQALEYLVDKHVRSFQKVKDCKGAVLIEGDSASIHLQISVMPDVNLPEITEELQTSVKNNIQETTGVTVSTVQTMIVAPEAQANITNSKLVRSRVE